jgi:hypothetical protein
VARYWSGQAVDFAPGNFNVTNNGGGEFPAKRPLEGVLLNERAPLKTAPARNPFLSINPGLRDRNVDLVRVVALVAG